MTSEQFNKPTHPHHRSVELLHRKVAVAARPLLRYSMISSEAGLVVTDARNCVTKCDRRYHSLAINANSTVDGINDFNTANGSTVKEIIDTYLVTVSRRSNATFSKGWFKSAHDVALSAITDLTETRNFKELHPTVQLRITQELMKYSIKYVDRSTAQIVHMDTIEGAAAFDPRIVKALTKSEIKVANTDGNRTKVKAIFAAAIQRLCTGIDDAPADIPHPLMAARYVSGRVAKKIAHEILNTTTIETATNGLTPIQKREVLVRIALELIASNYTFDPKDKSAILIAALTPATYTPKDGDQVSFPRLSRYQRWLATAAPAAPAGSPQPLIDAPDVFRFLYNLDTNKDGRGISAEQIVQTVFPAIDTLATPVAYLVRRFPLVFNVDSNTGKSLDVPLVTTTNRRRREDNVPEVSNTWSALGFDTTLNPMFKAAITEHSEETYETLLKRGYGLPAKLVAAAAQNRADIERFINHVLPTDSEPGQAKESKSRAQLMIEHLFPVSQGGAKIGLPSHDEVKSVKAEDWASSPFEGIPLKCTPFVIEASQYLTPTLSARSKHQDQDSNQNSGFQSLFSSCLPNFSPTSSAEQFTLERRPTENLDEVKLNLFSEHDQLSAHREIVSNASIETGQLAQLIGASFNTPRGGTSVPRLAFNPRAQTGSSHDWTDIFGSSRSELPIVERQPGEVVFGQQVQSQPNIIHSVQVGTLQGKQSIPRSIRDLLSTVDPNQYIHFWYQGNTIQALIGNEQSDIPITLPPEVKTFLWDLPKPPVQLHNSSSNTAQPLLIKDNKVQSPLIHQGGSTPEASKAEREALTQLGAVRSRSTSPKKQEESV